MPRADKRKRTDAGDQRLDHEAATALPARTTDPHPVELELKLAVVPADAARLVQHPLLARHGNGPMRTQLLSARYLDTADSQLARSGMALRLRLEGKAWVQTFKTSSGAALALRSRGEWEQPVAGTKLDWDALGKTPLAQLDGYASLPRRLRTVFTVRFQRRSWALQLADGTRATASLDDGDIVCGRGATRRSEPISEFELEFESGDPAALWKFAGRLAKDLNLVPLSASKGERGHALASGARPEPQKTKMPDIDAALGVPAALALALSAALAALQHNLRHLDAADIEFVHQARVALRRLRSVLRAFEKAVRDKGLRRRMKQLAAPLKELGQVLGAARDADVFLEETMPAMGKALGANPNSGLASLKDPVAKSAAEQRETAYEEVMRWLETPALGQLLLTAERLVFEAANARAPGGKPLDARLGILLAQQHDRVQRAAAALSRQSSGQRHELRKEVKRLRYLLDIAQALWPKRATKSYRKALEDLQEQLGELNDVAVAGETLTKLQADSALRRAWAAHERTRLAEDLPQAAQALAALDLADVPWRGDDDDHESMEKDA
ncbi:MAG: CHAD domain-containing protein [Burkholderiales bacterium]